MKNRKALGAAGELAAARYLAGLGYRIAARNVRPIPGMARGEIDIVAWEKSVLVFVEVKTRRSAFGGQGSPVESINRAKRRQLVMLANAYIGIHRVGEVSCRFDVVIVTPGDDGPPNFELIRDAFDGSDL